MFKKFFGKKNDGFYLQLEDDDAQKPAVKAKPEAVAPATPAPATKQTAPVAAKTEAAVPAKSEKKAEAPKAVEQKAPVVTAPPAPPITNFATDYLIKPSSNSSRRLPGANMRGFLDLARKIDKPTAFKATAIERKASEKAPATERKTTEK
ncbi:hypothetical protein [Chamaesiphon minutus]|uniref:Uncharacterized protein n=1 Tax=Chamaesiphon minutus (strain ATCC 27169 / PCC 6605) TaxID=1173020 RepID=K9UMV5_CHAP6|nr:hypothetical protein [Chamaesiphon minutus]AFY96150.1 hypothetical protein Cha6605_5262 [Chamaesiphon minutus PCC 6605]